MAFQTLDQTLGFPSELKGKPAPIDALVRSRLNVSSVSSRETTLFSTRVGCRARQT